MVKGAVPFSNLFHWKQSRVLWLPFLSCGQAQHWHSPAAFRHCNSLPSIPSVWVLKVLIGFFLTTPLACRLKRLTAFLSCLDCSSKNSQLSIIGSWISVSVVLIDSCPESLQSLSEFFVELSDFWCRFLRLLIWMINPSCIPRIEDIHQTLCAKKIYWLSLAKDITFSKAYPRTSLSLSKVIVIRNVTLIG